MEDTKQRAARQRLEQTQPPEDADAENPKPLTVPGSRAVGGGGGGDGQTNAEGARSREFEARDLRFP